MGQNNCVKVGDKAKIHVYVGVNRAWCDAKVIKVKKNLQMYKGEIDTQIKFVYFYNGQRQNITGYLNKHKQYIRWEDKWSSITI